MKNVNKMLASATTLGLMLANSGIASAAGVTSDTASVTVTVADAIEIYSVSDVTMDGSLTPGAEVEGTSTFNVRSNQGSGYNIQAKLEGKYTGAGAIELDTDSNLTTAEYSIPSTGATSSDANYFLLKGFKVDDDGDATNGTGNTIAATERYQALTTADVNYFGEAKSDSLDTTNGDKVTMTYAAKVDNTKAAGDYKGTITYTITTQS